MSPRRTCVGCRRVADSPELLRLTAVDRRLVLGAGRGGRGAWLCRATALACFDQATAKSAWQRSLRTSIERDSVCEARAAIEVDLGGGGPSVGG